MMGTKLADKPRSGRKHALRNMSLASLALGVIIVTAMTLLNQSPAGAPPVYSPAAAVLIVVFGIVGLHLTASFYMRRTDEHDVLANLKAMANGWLVLLAGAPAWWMLNRAGLVGPVDLWTLYVASAVITSVAWTWYRFR